MSVLIKLEEGTDSDTRLFGLPDLASKKEERVAVPTYPSSSVGLLYYILIRKRFFFPIMIWVCHMSLFSNKLVNRSLPLSIAVQPRDSLKIIFLY